MLPPCKVSNSTYFLIDKNPVLFVWYFLFYRMEAETAGAQVQNLEYDLTEATRVREETSQRLQEIDGNITAITTTASQVGSGFIE